MFTALNNLFDLAMRPMRDWPPEASCALFSTLIAVLLLFFFKYVSMQSRIERVKDKMTACVLGVWLYRDQPAMIARCQVAALGHGLHYLGLNLLPLAVMALPMMLILGQMNAYLAHRPLAPGSEVIVTTTLAPANADTRDVSLTPATDTRVLAVNQDTQSRQIAWKLACDAASGGLLTVTAAGQTATKSLVIGSQVSRIEPTRTVGGFWHLLIYPSEATLPEGGPIEAIHVAYPERDLKLLAWPCHWLWSCFAVMLVAVLLFRKPMGVAI